ncbi:ATP-binding protein [Clostridium sp.]|uniref:ATP-binding protein n=1 Tax=Clostridium sp. TaxID=1506 RepID=UPI002FC75ACF
MIACGVIDPKGNEEIIDNFHGYVLDSEVDIIEDYENEFKEIKGVGLNPINTINSTISEYAASFLNSQGGRIYYGITNDRVIKGVKANPEKKDEINRIIYNNLANIQPPISPDYFEINYYPILNSSNEAIEDLYIIEVITPLSYDRSAIYFINGNNLFVRVNGVKKKLCGNEIVSFIRKKLLEETFK